MKLPKLFYHFLFITSTGIAFAADDQVENHFTQSCQRTFGVKQTFLKALNYIENDIHPRGKLYGYFLLAQLANCDVEQAAYQLNNKGKEIAKLITQTIKNDLEGEFVGSSMLISSLVNIDYLCSLIKKFDELQKSQKIKDRDLLKEIEKTRHVCNIDNKSKTFTEIDNLKEVEKLIEKRINTFSKTDPTIRLSFHEGYIPGKHPMKEISEEEK